MPTKKKNPGKYTLGRKSSLHDVELPSGATCQARRPGVQGLLAAGVLDNFDQLTALIQTEHIDKKAVRPPSAGGKVEVNAIEVGKALLADKAKMDAGFQLIDKLVAFVVTQPVVWIDYQLPDESDEAFAKREHEAERDEALGISEVDLEDRLYLMNWAVGGTSDLAAFRERLAGSMAGMAAVQSVQDPAE